MLVSERSFRYNLFMHPEPSRKISNPASSRRFKLTVAYDGTAYSGWQVQPDKPTVQQVLEETLKTITGQSFVKVHGSGRTDQGVHGRGQVAHVDLETRMTADAVLRALNSRLPQDIRILKSAKVRSDFHARKQAAGKEYRYFVWNDPIILPDKRFYALHNYYKLDLAAMRRAAAFFEGEHDFAAFAANNSRVMETTVRTVYSFKISKRGPELTFRVSGSGFMYKQVRSMVGFLLQVGRGVEEPENVRDLLADPRPRKARIPSAPAHGLFLWRVWY